MTRNDATGLQPPAERYESLLDPIDGTRWVIDLGFTASSWHCIWDRGCQGILDHPAPELQQGCCSVGAELLDHDEARTIGALGASLDPNLFQYASVAASDGVFADAASEGAGEPGNGAAFDRATRVVDGACIFLNRPGFAGGEGCALHLGAVAEGESPVDWKPSVCWQVPIRVEDQPDGSRLLRRWRSDDWGDDGVAWTCTQDRTLADAYSGSAPVVATLERELTALVGREVYVELRGRTMPNSPTPSSAQSSSPTPKMTDEQWLKLNHDVIPEFRANGGQCGGRWEGNPMVLLTTTGAKSGEERTSPLTYTTDGDRIVLIASRAGDDRHPDWFHNLVASPDVIIEVGTDRFAGRATVAAEPERGRLLDARIAAMPRFGEYVDMTDRTIPVVVIERTG